MRLLQQNLNMPYHSRLMSHALVNEISRGLINKIKIFQLIKYIVMNKKLFQRATSKLPYQTPQIQTTPVLLEYGVAAGSNARTSGDIKQTWDNEESQTQSKSDGWW